MKTMCPPGYHHNGLVATHAPGHMMYGSTLLVPMNQRVLNKQRLHICYAHLASVRFEHSVCRGSLMTTNIYIFIYIYICVCRFIQCKITLFLFSSIFRIFPKLELLKLSTIDGEGGALSCCFLKTKKQLA